MRVPAQGEGAPSREPRVVSSGAQRIFCCTLGIILTGSFFTVPTAIHAQEVFAYPTKGQSAEQQKRDRYECHEWAVDQSGFDPSRQTAPAQAAAPPPPPTSEPSRGGAVRGGARGAAVGAVGGAIAGDAGTGAAVGAATGALIGGMRRRDQAREQEYRQATQQQSGAAASSAQQSAYTRAMAACLQGRGYSVN